ncbi:MAG: leucine-rich repeat domain-containing protein [Phocaeicola sp.]|nr:leucine-rich repeat domain-containing protein [Phocaeicola sp.]
MKTFKQLLLLCGLVALAACSEDALVPQNKEIPATGSGSVDLISMVVPDIEVDKATTRSKLIDDGTELKFVWQENDDIGVIPMTGRPLSFLINANNAGKNTALFDGGGWALKGNEKYAAFYPITGKNQKTDVKHITIDYTGQTQGNWMKYDFLAAGAVQPKDGTVTFTMKRLSAILKIQVKFPSSSITHFRYATLIAEEPLFGVKGTLDLSGSEPIYTPEGLTKFINTDLGVDKAASSTESTVFTFYLMIPPTNLSGKQVKLLFNSDSGTAKEAFIAGQNYEAGKAYSINIGEPSDAMIRNSNLIVAAGLGDGTSAINGWTNREKILQVKSIVVSGKDDPTVCDEIGFFRNLETLNCSNNKITSLDVSNNPKLTSLSCSNNQLSSLDVSNNLALTDLYCHYNQLTSLDVTNNTALHRLDCYGNKLTSLDVSNNTALTRLDCSSNQLTSLDVTNNTALFYLDCDYNRLTSLDITNNTALHNFYCNYNQLTTLDISNNSELLFLGCDNNQLTSLDVSNNKALKGLDCSNNQLISLDVTNNTALQEFYCSNTLLTSLVVTNHSSLYKLEISNNPKLTSLDCSRNVLKTLDITGCTALKSLDCNWNRMTELDISSFFPTLTRYNVFCGNQKNADGEDQVMTLTHNAQDNTTFREWPSLRNYNVTLVPNE